MLGFWNEGLRFVYVEMLIFVLIFRDLGILRFVGF